MNTANCSTCMDMSCPYRGLTNATTNCKYKKANIKDFTIGIDIPFGAKDSELCGFTYTIPEGFEATIENGKVIVKRKESEDERTRKEIIYHIQNCDDTIDEETEKRMIAWLEKQKPSDNHEPKCEICINDKGCVTCVGGDQWEGKSAWSEEDEEMRKDAVAAVKHLISTNESWSYLEDSLDWLKSLKDRVRPQPQQEWSEEDKEHLESVVHRTEVYGGCNLFGKVKEDFEWLKDLPNRIQLQPKQEWSKEDEVGLGDAMWAIEQAMTIAKDENDMGNLWYAERWLKSLRPQNTWKPSEEQMNALDRCIDYLYESNNEDEEIMDSLYNDLKKLM